MGAKRGKAAAGISPGNLLADQVYPNLVDSSAQICKNVEMFGVSVEKLLIKHGKHIINEQFLLNRLAQSAIDIYISTCMISRCTQSLNNNLTSMAEISKNVCEAEGVLQGNPLGI